VGGKWPVRFDVNLDQENGLMALSFDATYYLSQRPDVFNAFVATNGSTGLTWAQFAERHYNDYGRFEGANPNTTFNTLEYLKANPDVAAAGVNPFSHYLQYGVNEGRAPSASFPSFASFDSAAYLAANTDLAGAGIDTKAEAYAHFVLYGQFEGRPGAPTVDTGIPGSTYTLTTGADTFTGTANNDTFTANVDTVLNSGAGTLVNVDTAQSIDTLNGGAGVDTLNVTTKGGTISLPSLASIEVINAQGLDAFTIDTSTTAGVTNVNVTKVAATKTVDVITASTTDVGVNVKASGKITIDGGKTVSVTSADSASAIEIGTSTKATGAVTVTATGAAASNANASVSLGSITVTGGSTINVTQKAAADSSALVAGGAAVTHTQGDVVINAAATTTEVMVKQDAAVTAASAAAVAGVTEVASVKFTKLDATQTVTVGGLTFTAAKNLTATEVAQAFANLTIDAVKPTSIAAATATGDTQGAGVSANGVFSGSLVANFSSGAASGDTVVFTGKANTNLTDLNATNATVTTTVQGVDAVAAKNTLGIVAGKVDIAGEAALKTVTIDGYGGGSQITGGTNSALDTVKLSNGAGFSIASTAATVTLDLNKVNGTVDVAAGAKTINATVNGASTDTATLTSASAETLNVSGTGNVAGNTSTGLTAATAISTTGMTAGTANFTIADGTKTSYAGGAGVDAVVVTNGNVAVTKVIDLGAGDDTLTLNGVVVVPTSTLKGGAGTDTIAMNGESAATLTASNAFAGKIEGFEKFSITDKVATARTVNVANLGGISYIVSNNADASAAVTGNKQIYSFSISGIEIDNGGSLSAGGVTLFTAGADDQTAADIIAALPAQVTINNVVYNTSTTGAGNITLTSVDNVAPQPAISVAAVPAGGSPPTNAGVTTTAGTADVTGGTPYLTIDKMVNGGTLELVGAGSGVVVQMADASGSADSLNLVTKVAASNVNFGTVTVAGVETLKLTATDSQPIVANAASIQEATIGLKADSATSLTIDGNSHVSLTLDAATNKLALIDASNLSGNLTASANGAVAMTIKGGSGADVLTASTGTNAKADILTGGAGADKLFAGSNGAQLTGGDGNDTFVVTAASATGGNKEANTFSTITDFKAGDILQLQSFDATSSATVDVTKIAKLAAVLDQNTAVFSDFVNAAIKEAGDGANESNDAVWFSFKGDTYVAIDSGADTDAFVNGQDLIVKLTGVNGDSLSFNSDYGSLALV
jgi:hypothetical protein